VASSTAIICSQCMQANATAWCLVRSAHLPSTHSLIPPADTVTPCSVYSGAASTSKPAGLCSTFNQETSCTTLNCTSGRYLTNATAPFWYDQWALRCDCHASSHAGIDTLALSSQLVRQ
jgi:hypothetical protein